jgi:hypothetical protein
MSDTIGTGAATYDKTLDALVTPEARARAMNSVADMLRNPGIMKPARPPPEPRPHHAERKIFSGLTIYVNGLTGTASPISDHRLKQDLVQNGAKISQHLARREVTHVILGRPSGGPSGGVGAGGGLAAGKLEREITRMRKSGVKFVAAEWYVSGPSPFLIWRCGKSGYRTRGYCADDHGRTRATESIEAGRRLPESRFANLKVAASAQPSVRAFAAVEAGGSGGGGGA